MKWNLMSQLLGVFVHSRVTSEYKMLNLVLRLREPSQSGWKSSNYQSSVTGTSVISSMEGRVYSSLPPIGFDLNSSPSILMITSN